MARVAVIGGGYGEVSRSPGGLDPLADVILIEQPVRPPRPPRRR